MKYEYLVFDLDDTLIDNKENVRCAFKKMLEYLNKEYSDEIFNDWYYFDIQYWDDFANGLIEVPEDYKYPHDLYVSYVQSQRYVNFFKNIEIKEAFKINELFLNSLKEMVVAVDGADSVLKTLTKDFKIVVATNGPRQAVYTKLEKIGCIDDVNYVFSADMTKNTVTKPNKLFFEELMDYICCNDKDKVLIIGDSLKTDVKGGMNSLIDSCWFNRKNEKLIGEYQPKYTIKRLDELINLLENNK